MEPIFIYFDKVKFDNSSLKTFTITFSDGDLLDGVLFKKTNDYYITSMTSSITIEKDLKELKDYDNIKKISDIANEYIKNGINHFKSIPSLSSSLFSNINKDLDQDKTKEALSTVEISFIDLNTKKSNSVKIYSPYENLKIFGLKFSNQNLIYNLNLVSEKGELYINKTVELRKSKRLLINNAIRKTYSENLIMIKHNGRHETLYLPIAKYHYNRKNEVSKQRFEREILTHEFVYNSLFVDLTAYPQFIITVDKTKMSSQFPIFWDRTNIMIYPNTEIFVPPMLYEKLKTKIAFGSPITLTDVESYNIRTRYWFFPTNKKFYPFVNKDTNKTWTLTADNFILIDENIKITTPEADKQSIFNFSGTVNGKTTTLKIKSPKDIIQKLQSDELNFLQSDKINTKSLTYAHENFFLYDLENMIKPTFTTELQQEFNIYGLIYFSGEEKDKLHLIRPKTKLKFQLEKNIYKKEIKFELSKVHKKKTFNIVGNYISNFSVLRTEKTNVDIGYKRKMQIELVDEITILGIQNSEFNVLNPIYISINSDSIISKLQLYKNNRFRFVLRTLLFSSNIVNETDVIIITSNGLTNTKQALITKNNQPILESTLGVCFLNEIPEWNIVKGASKRVQTVFSDSEELNRSSNHLAFSFITKNISDLLQFSVTLLDGSGKEIAFSQNEIKLPIISFTIQIIK